MSKCPCCNKEKDSVGPKIVGKAKSKGSHLATPNDAFITKIMCQDCHDVFKASGEFAQKCLNPMCDNILFISGRLGPDTEMRGVDRDISFQNDSEGYFLECLKCHAKHKIEMWKGPEGSGGRWKIKGLRH